MVTSAELLKGFLYFTLTLLNSVVKLDFISKKDLGLGMQLATFSGKGWSM